MKTSGAKIATTRSAKSKGAKTATTRTANVKRADTCGAGSEGGQGFSDGNTCAKGAGGKSGDPAKRRRKREDIQAEIQDALADGNKNKALLNVFKDTTKGIKLGDGTPVAIIIEADGEIKATDEGRAAVKRAQTRSLSVEHLFKYGVTGKYEVELPPEDRTQAMQVLDAMKSHPGGAVKEYMNSYLQKVGKFSADELNDEELLTFVYSQQARSWAISSSDSNEISVAMHKAIASVFGTEDVVQATDVDAEAEKLYRGNKKFYDNMVQTIYDNTQKQLKAQGVKQVALFRGSRYSRDRKPEAVVEGVFDVEASSNPVTSYSMAYSVARRFGGATPSEPVAVMLAASVKPENIFATSVTGMGCLTESEVLVLNRNIRAIAVGRHKGSDYYENKTPSSVEEFMSEVTQ